MKKKSKGLTVVLMLLGIALILSAALMTVLPGLFASKAKERLESTAATLYSLIPEIRDGAPESFSRTKMPSLEVGGEDFCAILELPALGRALPVSDSWDTKRISDHPCRYSGSSFDKTLVIGGVDSRGQLDFMKEVSLGDEIKLTHMTGLRLSYSISDIRITKDARAETLTSSDADLVIFARNTYSADYTVISCKLK